MPTCKACGAEIVWRKTPQGKNMPLDAKPRKMAIIRAAYIKNNPNAEMCAVIEDAYTVHWETCPEADRFRSGKGEPQ